jgi:hypothetical protein
LLPHENENAKFLLEFGLSLGIGVSYLVERTKPGKHVMFDLLDFLRGQELVLELKFVGRFLLVRIADLLESEAVIGTENLIVVHGN